MANIQQAGAWLEAGKQVRRSTWLHNARLKLDHFNLVRLLHDEGSVSHEQDFVLSVSDLIADTWEIAD